LQQHKDEEHPLYVPGPATRAGSNELVILTLDAADTATARFTDHLTPRPRRGV